MKINESTNKRPTRAKINGVRNVLNVSGKDPNYQYRIVNDTGDRVAMMQERGYEVVTDPTVRIGERRINNPTQEGSVVAASVGGGIKGVLMRIKKEWYEEDAADKQAIVNQTEGAMVKQAKEGHYGKLEINSGR
ncbi:MAG: hypothetical protein VKL39_22050 [Leptolyngbyaceae bacterium]|nr:hypothetical protein [Leptolyngbyaceae bacterium]